MIYSTCVEAQLNARKNYDDNRTRHEMLALYKGFCFSYDPLYSSVLTTEFLLSKLRSPDPCASLRFYCFNDRENLKNEFGKKEGVHKVMTKA